MYYLLSKDSSPHFEFITSDLGYVVRMLEDFTCSSCLSEILDSAYNNMACEDKMSTLLSTQCGAEFSVHENESREALIKEWLLLEGVL